MTENAFHDVTTARGLEAAGLEASAAAAIAGALERQSTPEGRRDDLDAIFATCGAPPGIRAEVEIEAAWRRLHRALSAAETQP